MKEKNYIITFHVCFWSLNFLYGMTFWDKVSSFGRFVFVLPFYINYFILVPYFFKKGSLYALALWFVLLWSTMTALHFLYYNIYCMLNNCIDRMDRTKVDLIGGYISFYFIAISTGSRLVVDWMRNKRIAHALTMQKTTTQINFIRTNINIPFVLETLTEIEKQAEKSPRSIQQPVIALSNVLRYGLYDAQSESAPLLKEIEVIRDYFFLTNQNQSEFSLTLSVKGEIDELFVPANILVKFISAWKEFRMASLTGTIEVVLLADEQVLRLSLPLENSSYSFVNTVKEKFVLPEQNGFTIECEGFFRSIQLVIRKTKNED